MEDEGASSVEQAQVMPQARPPTQAVVKESIFG